MLKRDYGEDATRTTRGTGDIDNVRHVARVWAARILDRMGRPARHARLDQDVLIELGLIEHKDPMQDAHDVLDDRDRVRARRRELEAIEWAPNGHLARNLGFATSRFGLAEADCAVLAFLAICFRFEWLRELVEDAAEFSCLGSPAECAAAATGISTQAAWHALRREGRLSRCGFLEYRYRSSADPTDLPRLENDIRLGLWQPDFGEGFLEQRCMRCPVDVGEPELAPDQLPEKFGCIVELVRAMLDGRTATGQILIHGKPGTGKTRFALQIAEYLSAARFEVLESRRGYHLNPAERLHCFLAAQQLLHERERCLLVFDEADQVLAGSTGFMAMRSDDWDKAWLNTIIESALVPGIWIANDIQGVHGATLRRFAMIAEMPELPEPVRIDILRQKVGDLPIGHDWIRQMARTESVTPALMERAARVGRALGVTSSETIEAAMTQTLEGHCRAAGETFEPARAVGGDGVELPYAVEWLNTRPAIEPIAEGVAGAIDPTGRLLLHGPPGTGKTRLARELAEQADRPLRVVCASDLLDRYVGGTERNIRSVFERAARDRQVILLDEVDSLLADRSNAVRTWEVSQVNELLARIDGFEGLLLAATNRLEMIDSAVLRRFDVKIRFDYMKAEHAVETLEALVGDEVEIDKPVRDTLAALERLTPGDFRTAVRRLRITGTRPTPEAFIEALADEIAAKPGKDSRPIGFTARLGAPESASQLDRRLN